MSINLEYVLEDTKSLKELLKKVIDIKNYDYALDVISCIAHLNYHLNYEFFDDELEEQLQFIGSKLLLKKKFPKDNQNSQIKWIFYDCFGLDNKGLTEQYISALEDWNVEFLYILENSHDLINSSNIMRQLKSNKNAKIYILDQELPKADQLATLSSVIDEYGAERAFLHLAPWSSLSVVLWNSYADIIDRYFINITDHAFWLGKNSFDVCIDFREYGTYFSMKYREINQSKLFIQHFYPIIKKSQFQGFPFETLGKVIMFSGGSYYKIYGENGMYFYILKKILLKYKNVILAYAGSGDDREFMKFISNNNFQKRIFLLGHRSDINEVIKNSHIYLNTFPLGGGLLTQYAFLNKVPVIAYAKKELPMIYSETMLYKPCLKCTYDNLDEFFYEFNNIITSLNKIFSVDISCISPTRQQFSEELKSKIDFQQNKDVKNIRDYNFNHQVFTNLYFEVENLYLERYNLIKGSYLGLQYFKYDFIRASALWIKIVFTNFDKIMNKLKGK